MDVGEGFGLAVLQLPVEEDEEKKRNGLRWDDGGLGEGGEVCET